MQLEPRLILVSVPVDPVGAVLVLHGGASRGKNRMVSPTQLSVLRMIPIARRVARASERLAVFRLLNSRRGWDTTHTPVDDTRWALSQIAGELGPLPAVLLGHSLGGRAALLAAGEHQVAGAVALAPWVEPSDDPRGVDGKPILIIHGDRDRVASPERSAQLAQRLRGRTAVDYRIVPGGTHAMLRHHQEFSRPATEFAVGNLLDSSPA